MATAQNISLPNPSGVLSGTVTSVERVSPIVVGVVIVALGAVAVALMPVLSSSACSGLRMPGMTPGIIGACAVGIERVLEVFWTAVDNLVHAWWPLNAVPNRLNHLTDTMNLSLKTFQTNARSELAILQNAGSVTDADVEQAMAKIQALQAGILTTRSKKACSRKTTLTCSLRFTRQRM